MVMLIRLTRLWLLEDFEAWSLSFRLVILRRNVPPRRNLRQVRSLQDLRRAMVLELLLLPAVRGCSAQRSSRWDHCAARRMRPRCMEVNRLDQNAVDLDPAHHANQARGSRKPPPNAALWTLCECGFSVRDAAILSALTFCAFLPAIESLSACPRTIPAYFPAYFG